MEVWQTSNVQPLRLGEEIKKDRKKEETTGWKYICPHPAMQGGHKKITARFSRLLRHPGWKRRPILVLVPHKFVTYLSLNTLTHLLTALGSTLGYAMSNNNNKWQWWMQAVAAFTARLTAQAGRLGPTGSDCHSSLHSVPMKITALLSPGLC